MRKSVVAFVDRFARLLVVVTMLITATGWSGPAPTVQAQPVTPPAPTLPLPTVEPPQPAQGEASLINAEGPGTVVNPPRPPEAAAPATVARPTVTPASDIDDLIPPGLAKKNARKNADGSEEEEVPVSGAAVLFAQRRIAVIAKAGSFKQAVRLILKVEKYKKHTPSGNAADAGLESANAPKANQGKRPPMPDEGEPAIVYRLKLEARDKNSGELVQNFEDAVQLVFDMRGDIIPQAGWTWFIRYQDEVEPNLWYDANVSAHAADGLLSTTTTHFSKWEIGSKPMPWRFRWEAPSVSEFSGAAQYRYPIAVPPGKNGLTPNVDISYSSRGVDGLTRSNIDQGPLGLGWSFNTIQVVRNQTHYYRREHCDQGCPRWEFVVPDSFSLIFNGQTYDLKPMGALTEAVRYMAIGAPQINVWRVAQKLFPDCGDPMNNPGCWDWRWKVYTPDGTTYILGWAGNSETGHNDNYAASTGFPGRGMVWRVDTVTDVNGNQVQYDYYEPWDGAGGKVKVTRLASIRYNFTGRAVDQYGVATPYTRLDPNTARSVIRFEYTYTTYNTDQLFPNRVNHIWVEHLGATYRRYDLVLGEYVYSSDADCNGGQTMSTQVVLGITEFGTDGSRLPPTQFSYYSQAPKRDSNGNCPYVSPDVRAKPHYADTWFFAYLKQVDNGYGGATRFTYADDGRYDPRDFSDPNHEYPYFGKSYFVTRIEIWDGINSQPAITDYSYSKPCFNHMGLPGNLPGAFNCPQEDIAYVPGVLDCLAEGQCYGALVGFEQTTVTRKDYNGAVLTTRV